LCRRGCAKSDWRCVLAAHVFFFAQLYCNCVAWRSAIFKSVSWSIRISCLNLTMFGYLMKLFHLHDNGNGVSEMIKLGYFRFKLGSWNLSTSLPYCLCLRQFIRTDNVMSAHLT